jgi:diguanylate cyclase (GGDEF)-like protein
MNPFTAEELVRIQNTLLLSTGTSQQLETMLHRFAQAAHDAISLDGVHIYLLPTLETEQKPDAESGYRHLESIPPKPASLPHQYKKIEALFQTVFPSEKSALDDIVIRHTRFIVYTLKKIGIIVFEKPASSYDEQITDMLSPVIEHLAHVCQSCIEIGKLHAQIRKNEELEQSYELQAKQDPLTNLPNRRAFRYKLYQEIANTKRYNHYGAVMYIDLDHFKNINDSLGHSVGDMLLARVAERLKEYGRVGDDVFRIGGDEFVYILTGIGNDEISAINTSQTVACRVIEIMSEPIQVGEFSLHVTPSIGIAIFPDKNTEENDGESVLRHADTAMYRAKAEGRNGFAFYNPEMQLAASKRLIIEDHLRKALTNDELVLEYQPLVNIDGDIIGAESLLRWRSPVLGNVIPDDFIGIAEESNLILDVSRWALVSACTLASRVQAIADKPDTFQYISINISPKQFRQQDFVAQLLEVVRQTGVSPHSIRLEFTENILIDNISDAITKMEQLTDADIQFMLDDFGTGYSSLSYLHKLPIRTIKIDKSFVTGFNTKSYANRVIVDAMIAMTERMDLNCIIEGVETVDDATYFIRKGVHAMQGYHYYRPLAEAEFLALLSKTG